MFLLWIDSCPALCHVPLESSVQNMGCSEAAEGRAPPGTPGLGHLVPTSSPSALLLIVLASPLMSSRALINEGTRSETVNTFTKLP